MENSEKKGLAITSLIFGILALICCFCGAVVFAPVSIILAIISLATKRGGKGMAVTGIILSAVSVLFLIFVSSNYSEQISDFSKLAQNSEQYVQMYKETGEVPEEFQKYNDPKYDEIWKNNNYKNFEEFYADLISKLDSGSAQSGNAAIYSDFTTDPILI